MNKNAIPHDPEKPTVTSGVRIGTAAVTTRGFVPADMADIAQCIYLIASDFAGNREEVARRVLEMTGKHPLYTI